jgi:hypothetical protein
VPYWNFLPPRRILRRALIPCSVFSLLAPLWVGPQQHIAAHLPVAASASAVPEYETAAALPEAAAVSLNKPPLTESKRPSRQTPRKLRERQKLSKRSVAAIPEEE